MIGFDSNQVVAPPGATEVTLTIHRQGLIPGPVSVSYSTSPGTAIQGDYVTSSGMITWDEGDTTAKKIVISIATDAVIEGSETFRVILSNVSGTAGLDYLASATVTIQETPLEQWKFANFGNLANSPAAADDANPDGDQLTNIEEYLNASDPRSFTARSELPRVYLSNGCLQIFFRRNPVATDVTYTVQVSDDLETWRDGSKFFGSGPSFDSLDMFSVLYTPDFLGQEIGVQERQPSGSKQHFMRLKTTRP
jgi:hypothetical protein